jgi:hypothetical protein
MGLPVEVIKDPLLHYGKSYTLWLILIVLGYIAFLAFPNSPGLNFLLIFFSAAGSANTYRAKKDDDREIELKKIGGI